MHQMYQNTLQMMPSVLNSVSSVSVPNVTGVPNVTIVPNVPKMTKNDASMPKSYSECRRNDFSTYQHSAWPESLWQYALLDKNYIYLPTMPCKHPDNDSDHAKCNYWTQSVMIVND